MMVDNVLSALTIKVEWISMDGENGYDVPTPILKTKPEQFTLAQCLDHKEDYGPFTLQILEDGEWKSSGLTNREAYEMGLYWVEQHPDTVLKLWEIPQGGARWDSLIKEFKTNIAWWS